MKRTVDSMNRCCTRFVCYAFIALRLLSCYCKSSFARSCHPSRRARYQSSLFTLLSSLHTLFGTCYCAGSHFPYKISDVKPQLHLYLFLLLPLPTHSFSTTIFGTSNFLSPIDHTFVRFTPHRPLYRCPILGHDDQTIFSAASGSCVFGQRSCPRPC